MATPDLTCIFTDALGMRVTFERGKLQFGDYTGPRSTARSGRSSRSGRAGRRTPQLGTAPRAPRTRAGGEPRRRPGAGSRSSDFFSVVLSDVSPSQSAA